MKYLLMFLPCSEIHENTFFFGLKPKDKENLSQGTDDDGEDKES